MQKLGINDGRYHGETIDIHAVLREIDAAARQHGWTTEVFHESGASKWLALHRSRRSTLGPQPATRIYLSTGIHGDEPAGPLAALALLRANVWPADAEIFLLPCLNPAGFSRNTRENGEGVDLNRDYRDLQAAEVRAHVAWLQRQPAFDVTLCLHEDWESHGFYVYELNPERGPSLARKMVEAVAPVCPIDLSPVIEGRDAVGGVISPNLDPTSRPQWPEAFWLLQHKTRLSYTLEAPSDFTLATRVNALVAAVQGALGGKIFS